MNTDPLPTIEMVVHLEVPPENYERLKEVGVKAGRDRLIAKGVILATIRFVVRPPDITLPLAHRLIGLWAMGDVPVTDGPPRSALLLEMFGQNGPDEWHRRMNALGYPETPATQPWSVRQEYEG